MRERRGRVVEVRPLAPRVTSITIVCVEPSKVIAKAGQFISIRIPDGGRRSYSIVDAAGESDHMQIVLKAATIGGTADFVSSLTPGSDVRFFGPMGYFLFEPVPDGDIVLGATGVGITPLLPMLDEALASRASSLTLFWGLREQADRFFDQRIEQHLRDPRFKVARVFSGSGGGYITGPLLEHVRGSAAPSIYLCGHAAMIRDVAAGLAPEVLRHRVHTEVFYPIISTS